MARHVGGVIKRGRAGALLRIRATLARARTRCTRSLAAHAQDENKLALALLTTTTHSKDSKVRDTFRNTYPLSYIL